jgi:hypothetical protein
MNNLRTDVRKQVTCTIVSTTNIGKLGSTVITITFNRSSNTQWLLYELNLVLDEK